MPIFGGDSPEGEKYNRAMELYTEDPNVQGRRGRLVKAGAGIGLDEHDVDTSLTLQKVGQAAPYVGMAAAGLAVGGGLGYGVARFSAARRAKQIAAMVANRML